MGCLWAQPVYGQNTAFLDTMAYHEWHICTHLGSHLEDEGTPVFS